MALIGGGDTLLHVLHACVTCAALVGIKLYRSAKQRSNAAAAITPSAPVPAASPEADPHKPSRQRRVSVLVEEELRAAREALAAKDVALRELQQQASSQRCSQGAEVCELRARLRQAQTELLSAGERCREAGERTAKTASELSVTETELRAQRAQVAAAAQQLQDLQTRLEATEGELGLTRSQNLLMQREVATLHRQLAASGQQLEAHLARRAARRGGDALGAEFEYD